MAVFNVKPTDEKGGSGASLHTYKVTGEFDTEFSFQCDNANLTSYAGLANYLQEKGFIISGNNTVFLPVVSSLSYSVPTGIGFSTDISKIEILLLGISSGELYHQIVTLNNNEDFSITKIN